MTPDLQGYKATKVNTCSPWLSFLLISHVAYTPSLPVLNSWLFPTDGLVCRHLLTLVPRSGIFIPWRWRRYVLPKRWLAQDLHIATSNNTTFFNCTALYRFIRKKQAEGKSNPSNRLRRLIGLWDVEAPTLSRQSAHRWRWGCQPYAQAAFYPQGRFLVLNSLRGWVHPRAIIRLGGLGQLKIQWTHREDIRELLVCSKMPQSTTLPRGPLKQAEDLHERNEEKLTERKIFIFLFLYRD
jgi:hypothetical protein